MKVIKIIFGVIIFCILAIVIDFGLGFILGFKETTYCDTYTPPKNYYVFKSKISGINYTKVYHSCSYVDCEGSYSYSIYLDLYFKDLDICND